MYYINKKQENLLHLSKVAPKKLWRQILNRKTKERICHLYETLSVEDESHFLLEYPMYTHIRLQFHNLCYNTYLPNLLTCQNYGELRTLLSKLIEHRNKILQQNK